MAYTRDYWEWENDEKKGLSSKGKAKVASELSNIADLGKKVFGTSDEERAAYSAVISNTPKVKKTRMKGEAESVVDPTKDDKVESESPIFSVEDEEYRKKKKKHGLA